MENSQPYPNIFLWIISFFFKRSVAQEYFYVLDLWLTYPFLHKDQTTIHKFVSCWGSEVKKEYLME